MKSVTQMGVVAVAALAAVACQQATEPTSDLGARPSFALVAGPNPKGEEIVVCKVGPLGTYDFTWSGTNENTGAPIGDDFTINVTDGTGDCVSIGFFGGLGAVVDVTETVPAGQEVVSITVDQLTGPDQTIAGPATTASGVLASGDPKQSAVVTFTNRVIPPPPPPQVGEGRMTGGGFSVDAGFKVTGGFTIHCDITLSNNIQINWPGNKWHLTKPITSAICLDDPNVDHGPPAAPFDTFIGEGLGKLNGVEGSLIKFTFVDAGEPGKNDLATIQIFPPGGGAPVLDFGPVNIRTGNLQAHYDQPHGSKAP